MEDRTNDRSATRPETVDSRDAQRAHDGDGHGAPPRPALSLVSESSAKGTADDKEIMAMYAAMLPRAHILGRINRRILMMAGGVGLLLIAVAVVRDPPASKAAASPAESGPAAAATVAAPAAPVIPANAVPAPSPPTAVAPVADQQAPSPTPTLAATPVPAAVAPLAAAQPASKPQQEPAPTAGAVDMQNTQGCRDAIKKRDHKVVSALCESALAADPSLAKPLLALAKAQFENGRAAKAAVWARKIVQVNNSLADAYLIIGVAEQEALNPAAAKTAYQRYLQLAPNGPFADDVRSSLKSL